MFHERVHRLRVNWLYGYHHLRVVDGLPSVGRRGLRTWRERAVLSIEGVVSAAVSLHASRE